MEGIVFDIQKYSTHDGPGIRTVVFLKGCPLRCLWCCNPESQRTFPELEYRYQKCIKCGECAAACPKLVITVSEGQQCNQIDRTLCDHCGICAEHCPTGALRIVGRWMSVDEVLAQVQKDRDYYRRSGGGITLSGGEPFLQGKFAIEILENCYRRNIHTAVETTGNVEWTVLRQAADYTDLFLYDLKHMDSQIHKTLTGVSNDQILENLRRLTEHGSRIIIRIPVIPGLNFQRENLRMLAAFLQDTTVREIHLMPFHQLGKDKYKRLGRDYALPEKKALRQSLEDTTELEQWKRYLEQKGFHVETGG